MTKISFFDQTFSLIFHSPTKTFPQFLLLWRNHFQSLSLIISIFQFFYRLFQCINFINQFLPLWAISGYFVGKSNWNFLRWLNISPTSFRLLFLANLLRASSCTIVKFWRVCKLKFMILISGKFLRIFYPPLSEKIKIKELQSAVDFFFKKTFIF